MLVKVVFLFLMGMAILALVASALFPGSVKRRLAPGRCAKCGRPKIGKGPCDCERKRLT